jgi:hypothetical protein
MTNFPLLLTEATLPSEMFDADGSHPALDGGGDIMFTSDQAGMNRLSCEVVTFDTDNNPANGKAEIWVNVPFVSGGLNTTIWVWYENGAATQPPRDAPFGSESVWDSNYQGIWHLQESPDGTNGEIKDSTFNVNHGTTVGGMDSHDSIDAKIGKGLDLDGSPDINGDRIEVPDSPSLDSTNGEATIQMWLWWENSADGNHQLVMSSSNRYTAGAQDGYEWASQGPGNHFFYPWGGHNNNYNITSSSPYTDQTWQSAVITFKDSTVREVDLYIDGAPVAWDSENVPTFWTTLADPDNWIWGGNADRITRHFDGVFDEIRVSNIRRTADWIETEFNNQNDPSTFVIEGTPQTP